MNKHTAELLEKHFDTAFAAPNGIKKLRELILTLAMQGKLVPQDPNEQPASELLQEIEAEKQRLVKAGTIKKLKPLPPVTEEEKPYSLPQGWGWIRLGGLLDFEYGDNLPERKRANSGEFPVYGSNGVVGSHNKAFINTQCIVIGRKGSAGALNLCLADGCCVTDVAYYCIPPKQIDLTFCFRLLHTLKLDSLGKGIKPGLNRNEAYILVIAIPPRKEQLRIVAKIDELMARCDELEKLRTAQQGARLTVHATAIKQLLNIAKPDQHQRAQAFLAEHFGELYTVKENVAELRKAILQLAVMGKLVLQNPDDQPASELLKEISASRERLLKNGYLSESESRGQLRKQENQQVPKNLPALPQGWAWSTLMKCALIVVDCHNKTAPYSDSGIVLLRTSNIRNGQILLDDVKYVSEEIFSRWAARVEPQPGDILITREAPMGEVCIIPKEPKVCMGQRMMLARLVPETISPQFLLYSLRDPNLMERVQDKPVGMTVQHLRVGGIETLLIPLPPLLEQNRIVAKIDELMALCDSLEQQIDANTSKQTELLGALIRAPSQGGAVEDAQRSSPSTAQVIDLATYRASIGCYAINKLATAQYFGRTAAAKVMYLAQAHVGLDLDLKPEREAAGPLDTWIYDFERQGQGKRWFEVNEKTLANGRKKTEYRCLSALSEPAARAEALMLPGQKTEFDRLIYALADKKTEEVEIIATLFAVWNDFLIDGVQPTDEQIISDVRENWHERKARFLPAELGRWLDWLRRENIIPQGLPPRTVQQSRLDLD
ncbi:restriction endonuclease subunit S [Pseudomonas paraeruginosa]|uniref:restriction endonuclease subunit S n=1 Tax=Pseudomonas paraeruginosa TaxID=2994495 RepID=UPI0039FDB9A7